MSALEISSYVEGYCLGVGMGSCNRAKGGDVIRVSLFLFLFLFLFFSFLSF